MQSVIFSIRRLAARMRAVFGRDAAERDMAEEMRAHLELQAAENVKRGMNADEARYAALREFGNVASLQERARDVRGLRWLEDFFRDLGFAVRSLRKSPGFTAVAVLSLALGIGASTAVFSLFKTLVLQPLPLEGADRLVDIIQYPKEELQRQKYSVNRRIVAHGDFLDWKAQSQSFEAMSSFATMWMGAKNAILMGDDERESIHCARAFANLFPLLRVQPMLGRAFRPEEDDLAADPVAILSHGLWQRRFGASRDILGKTITVAKGGNAYVTYTVVGVMPRDFPIFGNVEVWLSQPAKELTATNRGWPGNPVGVIARLKPGVTVAQAQKEMEVITSRIYQTYPGKYKEGWAVAVTPIRDVMGSEPQRHLLIVFAVAGCVMLIACANVANLLLVRAAARQREIAIRAVVGAGRSRLVRQLLVESLLLAGLGGALGVLLAISGIGVLGACAPSDLYVTHYRSELPLEAIGLDGQALAFTCVLALLTGVLFGLVPALRASRPDLNHALKDGGQTATAAPGGQRLTKLLVVGQMALALVLVTSAGLLAHNWLRLAYKPLGYVPENLLRMRMDLSPRSKFSEPTGKTLPDGIKLQQPKPQWELLLRELLQRIRRLPGVEAVTVRDWGYRPFGFAIEGQIHAPTGGDNAPGWHAGGVIRMSPDGFRTLGMRLLQGRDFNERDRAGTPPVVVVNETFARRYLPNWDPLGRRLVTYWGEQREIVGVVADNHALWWSAPRWKRQEKESEVMYWPLLQTTVAPWEGNALEFMIRTGAGLKPTAAALRSVVREIDPEQAIQSISSMKEIVVENYAQPRFNALVFGGFAGLALILSAIGVYGVMAFSVTQRTHEIGVRMAMGAERLDVMKMVVRQGMRLALLGVAIGLAGAMAATRMLASLLYEITPTDPLTAVTVTLLLTGVALLACYIPARRATKVDPMTALRCE